MTPIPETEASTISELQSVIDSLGGIEHAKKIAAALPKTADGVPSYPEMTLFSFDVDDPTVIKRENLDHISDRLLLELKTSYSTHEAAAAAFDEKQRGDLTLLADLVARIIIESKDYAAQEKKRKDQP